MNEADISQTLGQHLQTPVGLPPAFWDNQDVPKGQERPYVEVQMVRVGRQNIANDGSAAKVATGFMQVTVVVEDNTFATEAETIGDTICDHFPKALELTGATGNITITDEPDMLPGFRDGPEWRVPVRVEYIAL